MQRTLLTTSALLLGAAPLTLASAQEASEPDASARTLQTITVTATKRERTLQDTPVAVTVVDDEVIKRAEILDLGDLQSVAPSLRVGQLQTSANTNFFIRGFGNGANNAGIEPSVGVFIDGVYRSRSAAQIADLPSLERVEVLKGPQSTLFGKNASAGVISIVTESPQREPGGDFEVTGGNYGLLRSKGYLTGPITDTLAFSIGGNFNTRGGYADDLALDSDVNDRDRWGLRGQLLFQPTSRTSFRLIADYDEIDETCCVAGNIVNGPTGDAIFAIGGALDPENPFSYNVFNNLPSTNEIENGGLSLQADFGFEVFDLTSITAYRISDLATNQDSDFTSADLIGDNIGMTEIETFTQEVRLTSNAVDARFDWMVGGFFFDETVDIENEITYGDDIRPYAEILAGGALGDVETGLLGVPEGAFFRPGQGLFERFGQDNQAFSLFGTLDFHATDRLTATIGLNYTEDEKDAFADVTSTEPFSAIDFVAVGNDAVLGQQLIAAGVNPADAAAVGAFAAANPAVFSQFQATALAVAQDLDPASPTANPLAGLIPLQFFPPFLNYPNAVEDGRTTDDKLTYTARLAYEVTDAVNIYGSVATGFKASSWNLSRDSRPFAADFTPGSPITDPAASPIRDAGLALPNLTTGTRFAGPEDATVYELGLKAAFDRVSVNLAVFDQTIEGFQSNVFTGSGFALANAGEQSVQGAEIDVTWTPVDPLTLVFAGTFLDPVYDEFRESAGGDISGQQPAGIPETALYTAATYTFVLGGYDAFVRGDWQYESETELFDEPVNRELSNNLSREINLFNASFGVESPDGFGVTVWTRNLFEDEFITTAFPSVAQAGSISGYPNQPRTYGATLRKSF